VPENVLFFVFFLVGNCQAQHEEGLPEDRGELRRSKSRELRNRGHLWLEWAKSYDDLREDSVAKYDAFSALSLQERNKLVDEDCMEQIEKDIHRTYPEVEDFKISENLERLERLLCAVAHHHSAGYSQSMNYIAGMVMINLKDVPGIREGDMFWLSMTIFERILPQYAATPRPPQPSS